MLSKMRGIGSIVQIQSERFEWCERKESIRMIERLGILRNVMRMSGCYHRHFSRLGEDGIRGRVGTWLWEFGGALGVVGEWAVAPWRGGGLLVCETGGSDRPAGEPWAWGAPGLEAGQPLRG